MLKFREEIPLRIYRDGITFIFTLLIVQFKFDKKFDDRTKIEMSKFECMSNSI